MQKFKLRPGFIFGEELMNLFNYCKKVQCAIPAVNVSNSNTMNAALLAARAAGAPIIIQFSHGGSAAFAGQGLNNDEYEASILGASGAAMYLKSLAILYGVPVIIHTDHCPKKHLSWLDGLLEIGADYYESYGEPLFSSHMLDLSAETLGENIKTSASYLRKMSRLAMLLEIEIGLTGGVEEALDNSGVPTTKLYSKPADVLRAYEELSPLGNLSIAAAFGNLHGTYAAGVEELRPQILRECQDLAGNKFKREQPLNLVFHGGSGSELSQIKEALGYGVVKFNLDTDMQWSFTKSVKAYMDKNEPYLRSEIGNPEGKNLPNKKYFDPRAWLKAGEEGMARDLEAMFVTLNCQNKFEISG